MPKKAAALSALVVGRLVRPGRHAVGGIEGLVLDVSASGARSWVLRYRAGGRRRELGLGAYPAVTLAAAREKARQARADIAQGVDPIEARKAARSALQAAQASALTFDECARQYIAAHEVGWRSAKHAAQWSSTIEAYCARIIGSMLVRDIETAHVVKVLTAGDLWTAKTETASRLRGRIESILDWARVRGLRTGENPARWRGHLDALLPAPAKVQRVGNHAALDWHEAPAFWAALAGSEGMGAAALRLAILTAARSGEVRGATWEEIDWQARTWTVPAARMKAGREHRVPLSTPAVALLRGLPRLAGADLIFPGARGGAVLSDMTLGAVIRRLHEASVRAGGTGWVDRRQQGKVVTAHGVARSSFRTWAAEATTHPREVAEAALAHLSGDAVERAYQRGDLFERRRRLMDDWGAFLAKPAARVIALDRIDDSRAAG